jgi:hypothetical protein
MTLSNLIGKNIEQIIVDHDTIRRLVAAAEEAVKAGIQVDVRKYKSDA